MAPTPEGVPAGPRRLGFRYALCPDGIEADRAVVFDESGLITSIERASDPYDGYLALPGMPNAHSHVFQRALAGFAEGHVSDAPDDFWGWREAMYSVANALSAEDLHVIALQAFSEMVAAGYTSVGEFHYLHHAPDGDGGPEMGAAVIEAAASVGIQLVLLPVFYQRGGFDQPPRVEQRRFVHASVDDYLRLLERLVGPKLGVAPHSLRAVELDALPELLDGARSVLGEAFPIHIHVSEQPAEVESCADRYGKTPIELLAGRVDLGPDWSLVHATYATAAELRTVREAVATVVLCPLTEANLADGLFPAEEHVRDGGRIAIGSDGNSRIDAVEELRLLEYGQRLRSGRRGRLATSGGLGAPLWARAARGGAVSLGEPIGSIEPGHRADLVVLEADRGPWEGHGPSTLLDAFLVGGARDDIDAVYIGGRKVAERGALLGVEPAALAFRDVVARLRAELELE